jgi:hypothetical protein
MIVCIEAYSKPEKLFLGSAGILPALLRQQTNAFALCAQCGHPARTPGKETCFFCLKLNQMLVSEQKAAFFVRSIT